ncbi:hypothetical protein N656DRAFT_779891 [Canariomyces notabilis]|uniref:Uncharacterized protein n=1 Tax=Canariomyces notabilis TaxID=2074819 RepID=A0AAN6TCD8_9PEZI|nr:hypothetical protein N656DRAFT_779891 [Canariomyces arenarius]
MWAWPGLGFCCRIGPPFGWSSALGEFEPTWELWISTAAQRNTAAMPAYLTYLTFKDQHSYRYVPLRRPLSRNMADRPLPVFSAVNVGSYDATQGNFPGKEAPRLTSPIKHST